MAATVSIPGVGTVPRTYVYVGAAAVAGIVAVAYYRAANRPADAEAPADGTDVAAGGYDAAADQSAEASYGYDYSGLGTVGGSYAGSYPDYRSPSYSAPVYSGVPTSNPEWADVVQEKLEDRGAAASAVSSAVGRYLAHLCLSEAQADLIRQAIGAVGEPPQGTHSVSICPGAPSTPATPSTPSTTPGRPSGLRATRVTKNTIYLDWADVKGAAGYELRYNGRSAGTTYSSSGAIYNLKSGAPYSVGVKAIGSTGSKGPMAVIHVRTARK